MLIEIGLNVAARVERIDDPHRIGSVAEEEDIAMRGRAAQVGAEFGACGAERPGEVGQVAAFFRHYEANAPMR